MVFINLYSKTHTVPALEINILSQWDKISSGYGFWSDMSLEDFLNSKVYGTNV